VALVLTCSRVLGSNEFVEDRTAGWHRAARTDQASHHDSIGTNPASFENN
jgi:hypothetical protein